MQNNAGTSLGFEPIKAQPTRPADSGRAGLIRAATHRWRMSGGWFCIEDSCNKRKKKAPLGAGFAGWTGYSAASRTRVSAFVRSVTSSSAAVGCTAMTASKSALVAFIFTAIPTS
jgi:hypothetical protein